MGHKILLLVLVVLAMGCTAFAGEPTGLSAPMSASIFKKINELRADPYNKVREFAEAENMTEKLPVWIEGLKGKSFKAVDFNPELLKTSLAHINDMSEKNYFSEISPEGATPSERIANAGISHSFAGEALGIVLFRNYIDNDFAEKSLFKTLVEYDLSKTNPSETLIFNEDTNSLAVAVKPGAFMVNGRAFNSYLAVCDGTVSGVQPLRKKIADMLTAMINQARMKPLSVLENMGYDESVSSVYNDIFYPSLQKIDYNREEFAKYGINSLPDTGYYVISRNNLLIEPVKNISLNKIVPLSLADQGINSITGFLFRGMLDSELMTDNPAKIILNSDLNRIYSEVSIKQEALEDSPAAGIRLDMAVWHEFNENMETSGLIYADKDGDGLYDPGEERKFEPILLFDRGIHARTDFAGSYYINDLATLSFMLVIFDEEKGLVLKEYQKNENGKFCIENLNEY